MSLHYRMIIPPSGPVTLTLRDGAEHLTIMSVPQFMLLPGDLGSWQTRMLRELRCQITILELAAEALACDHEGVPVQVTDRRPVHSCALPQVAA
jgi:hypothetical protein